MTITTYTHNKSSEKGSPIKTVPVLRRFARSPPFLLSPRILLLQQNLYNLQRSATGHSQYAWIPGRTGHHLIIWISLFMGKITVVLIEEAEIASSSWLIRSFFLWPFPRWWMAYDQAQSTSITSRHQIEIVSSFLSTVSHCPASQNCNFPQGALIVSTAWDGYDSECVHWKWNIPWIPVGEKYSASE